MTRSSQTNGAQRNERAKAEAIAKWEHRLRLGKPIRGAARKHHREAVPKGRKISDSSDDENKT